MRVVDSIAKGTVDDRVCIQKHPVASIGSRDTLKLSCPHGCHADIPKGRYS